MDFDFVANATVDDLQLVPEQFRGFYTEKDGSHTIAEQFVPLTTLTSGLAKSLKAARAEAKANKGTAIDLSPLSEFGATPAEIAEKFRTDLEDLQDKLAKGVKLDPEKIKSELSKGFDTKLAEKDTMLKSMEIALHQNLVTAEATRAIAESKGVPELLLPHISAAVKVVNDAGKYRVAVVDSDGDARVSSTTGQPMTIADLVREMKSSPVFGRAFESETAQGGGAKPGQQRQPPARTTQVMSSVDKIKAGLSSLGR